MKHRAPGVADLLLLLLLAPALLPAPAAAAPRLTVVVVIDQLRPDRIGHELPGGLGRLVREGLSYPEALHDFAMTETCPGHATILTGRHPAAVGIPANSFFDAERSRVVYCSEDPSPDAAVFGLPPREDRVLGRSPVLMRSDALGDWLKRAHPGAKVVTVSGKDRSAIMLGGRRPDDAWWFQRQTLEFTTSRYYRSSLPDWAAAFNDPETGFRSRVPEVWEHATRVGSRPDDFEGEAERFSRTSPHPLRDEDPFVFNDRFYSSPFLDTATLELARLLVEEHDLGGDAVPDLLGLALSATDVVGHVYGPYSQESRDQLERLDRELGALLAELEARVGEGGLLVALTADHGVLPLPEWLEAQDRATCPVDGGRVGFQGVGFRLLAGLHFRHSFFRWPRGWLLFAGTQVAVDGPLAERRGVDPEAVAASAERRLERHPAIAEVWNPREIREGESEMARLYRNSFDPERSGNLVVQVAEGCMISTYPSGTTHGSPWGYDRRVPLVFWGAGVEPGRVPGPARPVDVAPTLAPRLGVEPPPDLDGRRLF